VANIRVTLDQRADLTPGAKYYYLEKQGIPLRIEIGPRDLKQDIVTIVRRDTLEKQNCKIKEVVTFTQNLMEKMMEELRDKAWRWMYENVHKVDNLEEAKQLLEKKAGVVEVLWCGNRDCGIKLEEETNARVLGIPSDQKEKVIDGKCLSCEQKATNIVRVAKAY